jgi:hypothetical protein
MVVTVVQTTLHNVQIMVVTSVVIFLTGQATLQTDVYQVGIYVMDGMTV